MSEETKDLISRALRDDFDKNAGWTNYNKWILAAIEIGNYELAQEFKQDSKYIENAI